MTNIEAKPKRPNVISKAIFNVIDLSDVTYLSESDTVIIPFEMLKGYSLFRIKTITVSFISNINKKKDTDSIIVSDVEIQFGKIGIIEGLNDPISGIGCCFSENCHIAHIPVDILLSLPNFDNQNSINIKFGWAIESLSLFDVPKDIKLSYRGSITLSGYYEDI